MDYKIVSYPTGDLLKITRTVCIDIFINKISIFLGKFYIFFNFMLMAIQTYIFILSFDRYWFLLQASTYLGNFCLIIAYVGVQVTTVITLKMFHSIQHWKIDKTYKQTYKDIKQEANFINIVTIITTVVSVISGFLHMFPQNEEKVVFYGYHIFEKYFLKWQRELGWIYKFNFLFISIAMPATCEIMVYLTATIRFQMMLVLHYLERLDSDNGLNELELVYNQQYQEQVGVMLRNISKRFYELFRISFNIRRETKLFFLLYTIMGSTMGICVLIFYFQFPNKNVFMYARMLSLGISGFLTASAVIHAGQKVENLSLELERIVLAMKWYKWNRKNRQNHFLLALNLSRPFRIEYTESIVVNYNLGLQIYKVFYSAISILQHIWNSNQII